MPDTLASRVQFELEIKHSRFLASACPVDAPDQALAFLREVGVSDATHNCWAYRIGQEYRSSDDGEPSGTAGRPILAAIDGQGFDHVMVVVTRWYGGIKLGAGGLVRAYGGTAAECLRTAPRHPMIVHTTARLHCPFEDLGLLHNALACHNALKEDERFDDLGATITIRLPIDQLSDLTLRLRDGSRDRIRFDSEKDNAL